VISSLRYVAGVVFKFHCELTLNFIYSASRGTREHGTSTILSKSGELWRTFCWAFMASTTLPFRLVIFHQYDALYTELTCNVCSVETGNPVHMLHKFHLGNYDHIS